MKKFILSSVVSTLLLGFTAIQAQTTITQWNFNSNPPDASTSSGSSTPSTGSGSSSTIGGVTSSFASGTSNGGSSDPATTDNTGYGLTNFPASGAGNKTAGYQFAVSTAGYQNIQINFDLRHSNTGSRFFTVQYTTNVTVGSPTWVDFATDSTTAGDIWTNNRTYNFTSVTALNNDSHAAFRIVSAFSPTTGNYVAATSTSSYATTGTWRLDMFTVKGTSAGADTTKPIAQLMRVNSATQSYIKFNEKMRDTQVSVTANYSFTPALTVSAASLSASKDTVFLTHASLVNGQNYTVKVFGLKDSSGNTMDTATFTILHNGSTPKLVITEVAHSPNDMEFIEVYNADTGAINLNGFRWTDGTTGNFPNLMLAKDSTILFSTVPSTASAKLNGKTFYLLGAGLGSTNDQLVIRNTMNQIVDTVNYFVGTNNWPAAPTGVHAYSFELDSAQKDNNDGVNWKVPNNIISSSSGTILATPGIYPPPPVIVANGLISFVGTRTTVNETTSVVRIIAQLNGANNQAATAQLEVIPLATATSGTDYTAPATMMFQWDSAQNGNDTLTFQITNDNTSEFTEYFIVKMKNLVNAKLADSLNNHHTVFIQDEDKQALTAQKYVELEHVTSFSNGASGSNSAEIVAYDKLSKRLFIANSIGNKLDIINFSNPSSPSLIRSISLSAYGSINSVAAKDGKIALAIENNANPQANGKVVFMDTAGTFISSVDVGAMPDMITFNHSGTQVLTPNEGEPNTTYSADPNGSISIIDISGGLASVTNANVTTLDFTGYDSQIATLRSNGVRIFGLGATVAKDMEPEYITVLPGDSIAQVACQENNAIVIVNLISKQITAIRALGTKDFSAGMGAMDASDQGSDIHIAQWPVKGVYMPDAISSFQIAGQNYIITANEGDAREYNAFSEIKRISDATYILDSAKFPNRQELKSNLGRLNITTASGDTDGDGDFDEIHTFGSRSVSIFNATTGALVWDGGSDMEWLIAKHPTLAPIFNASNSNNTRKNRSDDKGPEPEGVATAKIGNNTYAFVALERIGGCMVYDVTNPAAPVFQDYKNTRNTASYGGDNGAEGIIHVPSSESPDGQDWVILANEVSSTLSIYKLKTCFTNLNKTITAVGNTEFCQGDSARLKAVSQSNVTYQWFKDNTTTGSTDSSFVAKNSGSYNAIVSTLNPSCSLTSNAINVVVNPLPTVTFNLPLDSICDTIVNLNLTGASPAGGSFKLNNNVITAFSPKTSGVGNYTITYEVTDSKGCKNKASDNIKVVVCKATNPPLGIQAADNSAIMIFPNPVQNLLYIQVASSSLVYDYSIYSSLGSKVLSGRLQDGRIDVSNLANGQYHLQLTDSKGNNYHQSLSK